MAKAKQVSLTDDMSFGEAAGRTVEVRAKEVFAHADGVLDTTEIENVHAMRVATRRLRAALEIFARCFPKREHAALLREVKALADALGERRDPDVQILALETLRDGLGQAERSGVNGLLAEIRARQGKGNERLEVALERMREQRLEERLAELAAEADGR